LIEGGAISSSIAWRSHLAKAGCGGVLEPTSLDRSEWVHE
jgi:hypothetical protein